MASRSRVIDSICVALALLCLPFVLCGTSEATVGGSVTWIIILLSLAGIFFVRARMQTRREQADRELVRELLSFDSYICSVEGADTKPCQGNKVFLRL